MQTCFETRIHPRGERPVSSKPHPIRVSRFPSLNFPLPASAFQKVLTEIIKSVLRDSAKGSHTVNSQVGGKTSSQSLAPPSCFCSLQESNGQEGCKQRAKSAVFIKYLFCHKRQHCFSCVWREAKIYLEHDITFKVTVKPLLLIRR